MRMIKMSQKDLTKVDTLDMVIELNEPKYIEDKMALIYCSRHIDAKIASAVAYRVIENYYGIIIINFVDNGFEESVLPKDLWKYQHLIIIGVSPNVTGMRTIRSVLHDNDIIWFDNQMRNIPMWTEYYMVPGNLNPERKLTEMVWEYYHSDEPKPDFIKFMTEEYSVIDMAKML